MEALTDRVVKAAPVPASGRTLIFDSHPTAPRGFGLRVSPAGKRTFVLRYNANGRDRLATIGEYPTWTLAAARKEAAAMRRKVDGGADILRERRMKRAEGTVADVVDSWCTDYADKLKSGAEVRRSLTQNLVPELGDVKITDVARTDFFDIIASLASRAPRQAALLLTYCKQMMVWCENKGLLKFNPITTLKPGHISDAMKANPRKRVLTDDEIRALWNADRIGMDRATLLALKFILVTGQRPGEVCLASVDEVHGNVWTIPAAHRGKTKDDNNVPLTATALELIRQAGGERFMFEAHRGQSMHRAALSHAVRNCRDALGMQPNLPAWRPHDLRRTVRTRLSGLPVTKDVAELTIGHVKKGIVAVYDQHAYADEKRAALEAWESRLLAIVAPDKPDDADNVVKIGRKRRA